MAILLFKLQALTICGPLQSVLKKLRAVLCLIQRDRDVESKAGLRLFETLVKFRMSD